ncbi:AP2 domain-containing protein [Acidithiobacillus thiooxidans]|uniref:AP2 domain-containing protein n=1 Tax=Acidithiobacillus thiooxidans TaxID=930 RepID=UPI001C071EC4|nr:AP2 domain-containing protein [Acidithiobacillus thiooxidans]MBU2838370.1 AP2 domain-containing protein [Acidithiobacillus thiooxidans]
MGITGNFGITRSKHKKGNGWLVRLYLPGENKQPVAQHYFADKKHGGTDKALELAKVWRDEKTLEHGVAPRKRDGNGYFLKYNRGNEVSGIIGVNLIFSKNEHGGFRNLAWQARFMVNGKQKNKSYSIFKYGYETAWRLAAMERSRHDGQPIPEKAPDKPDWIPK